LLDFCVWFDKLQAIVIKCNGKNSKVKTHNLQQISPLPFGAGFLFLPFFRGDFLPDIQQA